MPTPKRLVVGLSGASGILSGIRLLEMLREMEIETHLVVSKAAERTEEWGNALPQRSSFRGAYKPELQQKVLDNWAAYGF